MIGNNILALIITFAVAILWLRVNDFIAQRGWISSQLSRKIIHVGTGPLFVMCWILFEHNTAARYLAALVPLAITAQFALVGLGVIKDNAAVVAMSRTGDRKEILRGPLYYGVVFVLLTLIFWLDTPIGMVALMMLCGGDGLADVFGTRLRSSMLPWSKNKSLAGSAAMVLGGWLFSTGIVWFFLAFDVFHGEISQYLLKIAIVALTTTIVESLPFRDIDNISVPAAAVLVGYLVF